jgi:SanA protein
MKSSPKVLHVALALALCVAVPVSIASFIFWTLSFRYEGRIFTASESVPERPVALVFGAGYWADGTPSDVLKDRVAAAVALLQAGKVRRLILSGDNRTVDYNEPGKMREYALSLGCPPEAIVLDYAGRRTYDSCYRAQAIFGQRQVILVTQRYHLPRALYICEGLGLDAVGYVADSRQYTHIRSYWLREVPALCLAWVDRWLRHPVPVLGDPIPIQG